MAPVEDRFRAPPAANHMIYPRQPDGNAAPAPLVVSIDVSDIEFS